MPAVLSEIFANNLLQVDQPNVNVEQIPDNYVLFTPDVDADQTYGCFWNTIHPSFDNVSWSKSVLNVTTQAQTADDILDLMVTLWGIPLVGDPQLIGQKELDDISTDESNQNITFDLSSSAGKPVLKKISGTAAARNIQVNTPLRYENFESINFTYVFPTGWNYYYLIPITGSTENTYNGFTIGPVNVSYQTGMNTDFSDVRFAIWDGTQFQFCCYGLFTEIDSSSAIFFVKMPTLLQSPNVIYLYVLYGNNTAASNSNLSNVIYLYDNFEDGKFTSRSSPYQNWTSVGGTTVIANTNQIAGNYSIRHTGNNTGDGIPLYIPVAPLSEIVDFDCKLTAQGSGADDPYVALWYIQYVDSSNFVRLDTYWDGSHQILRLRKRAAGVSSTLATYTWTASKWAVNGQQHIKTICNGSSITVRMGSTKLFGPVSIGSTFASTKQGMGCLESAAMQWDNILIKPNVSNFVSGTGVEPTLGSASGISNNTPTLPTSPQDEDMALNYVNGNGVPRPYQITAKEYFSGEYTTTPILTKSLDVLEMGYDNVDRYIGLKQFVEITGSPGTIVKFPYAKYDYIPVGI